MTAITMLHSNAGELHQLYATFNRVWGEGGGASLSLETVDGKVSAVLKLHLGPPSAPRPGAPEAFHQAAGCPNQQPGKQRRRGHRGPGRQARDAARREAWKKRRQEAQPSPPELELPPSPPPPPPPPPAIPTRRLVTVVKDRASRSSFCQLDGDAREVKETMKTTLCCTICYHTFQSILSNQGGARRSHESCTQISPGLIEVATVTYLM